MGIFKKENEATEIRYFALIIPGKKLPE